MSVTKPDSLRAESPIEERSSVPMAIGNLDFQSIVQLARGALQSTVKLWGIATALGCFFLLWSFPTYAGPFLLISGAPCFLTSRWLKGDRMALPILPVFAVQNGIVYGLPLLVRNESLLNYPIGLLWSCVLSFLLFIGALAMGWQISGKSVSGPPSRWRFGLPAGGSSWSEALRRAGLLLLFASLAFEILVFSGLYWQIFGARAWALMSTMRTLFLAASLSGALLGGFAGKDRQGRFFYWLMIFSLFFFKISGLLISNAMGLVIAATSGLLIGDRKMPWRFIVLIVLVVGFFNEGKFVMRTRYWDRQTQSMDGVGLLQLPEFYGEWAAESASIIFGGQNPGDTQYGAVDTGQAFHDRINNLQNLLFVAEAVHVTGIEPLNGKGYALIPPLLIPRFLWADKPRAHGGQTLLNLHFGRQLSVEETESTFIAWGLLPEAIGNFGMILGPIIIGLFLGWLIGRIECWSRHKQLLSVEGLIGITLLLQTVVSFEMTASVLITSSFQFIIAVLFVGLLTRLFALNGRLDSGRLVAQIPLKRVLKSGKSRQI